MKKLEEPKPAKEKPPGVHWQLYKAIGVQTLNLFNLS